MEFTDLPRLAPSPLAVAIAASLHPRGAGARGSIDRAETEMLLTLIERADARKVVEIGVASGASSLYMLGMLASLPGPRQLFAFDNQRQYYADTSKLSGYLALESEFNRDNRFILEAEAMSLDARSKIAAHAFDPAAPVDLAFIDANHRHPWPTIDFLLMLPAIRRGGVVVLHDINLPRLTGASQGFGPGRLFACPFAERFVSPGDRPNMGAICIGDRSEMIDVAIAALSAPWEIKLSQWPRERLIAEIAEGPLADRADDLLPFFTR